MSTEATAGQGGASRNVNVICVALTLGFTLLVWFLLGLAKGPVNEELVTGAQSLLTTFTLFYFYSLRRFVASQLGERAAPEGPAPTESAEDATPAATDPIVFAFFAGVLILLLHEAIGYVVGRFAFFYVDVWARRVPLNFEAYDALPDAVFGFFAVTTIVPALIIAGVVVAFQLRRRFPERAQRRRGIIAFMVIMLLCFLSVALAGWFTFSGILYFASYLARYLLVLIGLGGGLAWLRWRRPVTETPAQS